MTDHDDDGNTYIEFTHLPGWVNVFLCDNGSFRWEATPGVISDGDFIYPCSFVPLGCGIERDFAVFDMKADRDVSKVYANAVWDVTNVAHEIEQNGIETEVISTFDIVVTLNIDSEPETVVFEGYNRLDVLPLSARFSVEHSAERFLLESEPKGIHDD